MDVMTPGPPEIVLVILLIGMTIANRHLRREIGMDAALASRLDRALPRREPTD